jgi:large-conductance mechanosensitive channel
MLSLKTGRSQRQKAEYMMASNMVAVTVIVPQVFKAIHFLLLGFFIFLATKLKQWVDQKGHSPIKKQELRQHLMQTVKLLSFLPKI